MKNDIWHAYWKKIFLALALILALAAAVVDIHSTQAKPALTVVARASIAAPTPTPNGVSHPGSTDGIMLMGVIIVIIVLLPLIFRKSTWTK